MVSKSAESSSQGSGGQKPKLKVSADLLRPEALGEDPSFLLQPLWPYMFLGLWPHGSDLCRQLYTAVFPLSVPFCCHKAFSTWACVCTQIASFL